MADEIIFSEPFTNPENRYEPNNINNGLNQYNINNGINENNINYVINYEESLNRKVQNFKVICCFIMCVLIFIEIILEIVFSIKYERDFNKIEWTPEQMHRDENMIILVLLFFSFHYFQI